MVPSINLAIHSNRGLWYSEPMYRIDFVAGHLKGKRLTIGEASLCIGSGPECSLRLADPTVAPRHAEIRESRGALAVRAMDASAPVLINDRPAGDEERPLSPHDKLSIGGHTLRVEWVRASAGHASSTRRAVGLSALATAGVVAVLLIQILLLNRSMNLSQILLMPFAPDKWVIDETRFPAPEPREVPPPKQHRMMEMAVHAEGEADPPADTDVWVRFVGPDEQGYEVPAFHDIGRIWKIRFRPPLDGPWRYLSRSSPEIPGLHRQGGRFTALPADGDHAIHRHGGILRVADGGRHLAHPDGTPFFWLGDTWWFCPSDLMPLDTAYDRCLETRADQGFSVIQMAFLGGLDTPAGPADPVRQARSGEIIPAYWRQVDAYIERANDRGLIPVFGLAFHSGLDGATIEQWQRLWRYVVARLGSYATGFLIMGEYNGDHAGDTDGRPPKALALGRYIRSIDPYKRALTIHPWYYAGDKRQAWAEPWYDVIMLQGGHGGAPPASLYLDAWRQTPPRPVLESECRYEGVRGAMADDVREVAWRAILSGSFGFTYGAHGLWYPTQSAEDRRFEEWGPPVLWSDALRQPGGAQMGILRDAMESVEWWRLAPAPDAARTAEPLPERRRILARTDGERVWLLYLPRGNPPALAIRLTGVPADAVLAAEWFDPRTGSRTLAGVGLRPQSGGVALPDRPDANDWILIYRCTNLPPEPPAEPDPPAPDAPGTNNVTEGSQT